MKHYRFFHQQTGILKADRFATDDPSLLEKNTPAGYTALEGDADHLSQRVDIATKKLVDYQPPAPSADHVWDVSLRRWILTEAAAAKVKAKRTATARISQLEASSLRTLREHALGDSAAAARLRSIDDEIAKLRADLN